jgi:hypothetical protein
VRVTFERRADRRPVETLVERDDGVVFALRGAGGGADLPHDLLHALVETELGMTDGIWGCIADGVVWGSMRHVSGRQPPHAGERARRGGLGADRRRHARVRDRRLPRGLYLWAAFSTTGSIATIAPFGAEVEDDEDADRRRDPR